MDVYKGGGGMFAIGWLKRNISIVIVLVLIFSVVMLMKPASPAYACSCAAITSVEENFAKKDAVFAGKVVNIKNSNFSIFKSSADPVEVTFVVSEIWKGPATKKVTLTTAESSASCGYEFNINDEYLVYAYENEGKSLESGLCSGTVLLSQASADLSYLGAGKEPVDNFSLLEPSSTNSSILLFIALFALCLVAGWLWLRAIRKR